MSEPKRLHPIVIVLNIGKSIKELIFTFIAFLFIGNKGNAGKFFLLIGSLVAVIFIVTISIVSWLRYTYRLEQGELRVEYGLFIRKKRYIPLERIQSLDLSKGILQRPFGLVKMKVETAGGGGADEADAVLSAITKQEAERIQEYVAAAKNTGRNTSESEPMVDNQNVYKITPSQLILLSLTSGRVGVVISAVLAFFSQVDELIPYEKVFRGFGKWAVGNIMLIAIFVVFGLILAWIIALVGTMFKYADFTVVKTEHDLIITQGLLERRQITIPLKRIQAIRINENIVRQLLGYGSVIVESAGGSANNQEGSNVMLLPLVKISEISAILSPHLKDYQLGTRFTPVPKRARMRYLFRSWFWVVPVIVLSFIFLKIWGLVSLVLFGLVTWWALLKFQDAGWNLNQQQLSLRYRTIIRTTVFIKKNKIQSVNMKESYFQRKKDLASVEAFVKLGFGGFGGQVMDLEKTDVKKIYSWYSKRGIEPS
jgi:putative membrane protein